MGALEIDELPHYTYDDYVQWEGRWELIHGIPYAMAPAPVEKHQRISQNIAFQLQSKLNTCKHCRAYLPVDWQITEDTIVQPDNIVICNPQPWTTKLTQTPEIVFEVTSPSSRTKDRITKFNLYQKAGVAYYIIIDPENEAIDLFILRKTLYEQVEPDEKKEFIFRLEKCDLSFNFKEIFS